MSQDANPPPGAQPTFDQFAAIIRYQPTLSFSPDGSQLAYSSNASGQFNLWRQPTDGGPAVPLTSYANRAVRQVSWSPDGATIAFTADRDGDEFYQIYAVPAAGGPARQLTDQPRVQHYLADLDAWSPDGRFLAYAGNDRVPADQDVLVRDWASCKTRRILAGETVFAPIAWSPDGRLLTVIEERSNADLNVYLAVVEGESPGLLTPHEGDAKFVPGPWTPDGAGFYLLTDEGREFIGLARFDLASRTYRWLETPDWDVETVDMSPGARILTWVVNEAGYSRLHVRDLATGQELPLPAIPAGTIGQLRVSPDGGKIGVLLSRPTHPAEIFVLDLDAGSLRQLTNGFLGNVPEADLVEPELVHFAAKDGRQIPAFLYRPRGNEPAPVVLSIHGGPEAQERPTYAYSGFYQYLVSRGIGVLAPNIRGSTGYGKSYQKLIHRDWGGAELGDLASAAEYLRSLTWVDPERIGVCGGSFGGFATLSCVSRLPDYWAAAVDLVGPSNLVTFARAVPPTWRRFMADMVGDPETEVDFLLARSPITYADQIRAPLFVIQGANDPRVVQSESDQIVERLRARAVPVRYDVYPDEGHGFTRRKNEIKALGDAAAFLEEYLLP